MISVTRCAMMTGMLALVMVATSAIGAEPAIDGYADYETFQEQVTSIAKSKHARLTSLGRTLGEREIYLLTIGTGKVDEKPAVLVVGSVEPSQLLGSELAVGMARAWAKQSQSNKGARRLLDRVTFYIIPRPSPDASEAFFQSPLVERSTNLRPMDDDRDGRIDEDGPEDLNGDGLITMMRVEDPKGTHITHPDDARVLIEADPEKNERGQYLVYTEGRDNDQDELYNEDSLGGVALNKNFTFDYPYFAAGAGPHQVSEIETRAIADFAFTHPNIAAVFSISHDDTLLKPWKPDESEEDGDEKKIHITILADDAPYVDSLAERYQKLFEADETPDSADGKGSLAKWAYFHYGRWSLAGRGWWIPAAAEEEDESEEDEKSEDKKDADEEEDERGASELNALDWFAIYDIDGFVDWTPIDHPDFPDQTVEVGGFRPFVRDNPPADMVGRLVETHVKFVRELTAMLPRIQVTSFKAEPLGANAWRITALVTNQGKLPTMPEMGQIGREAYPLMAELELPEGAALLTGSRRMQLERIDGSGGHVEVTWLLRLASDKPASVRLRVAGPAVGAATKNVRLVTENRTK